MGKLLLATVLAALGGAAMSQANDTPRNSMPDAEARLLQVQRDALGTGTPAPMVTVGSEKAKFVDDGYYHLPQYMPNYPTAAIIWPRVVEVGCDKDVKGLLLCDGYHWSPKLGRGEYLFVTPRTRAAAIAPAVVPTVIYKEVPAKKKSE